MHIHQRSNGFTHLLLTRFNLDYSLYDRKSYICDEEWHQHRFRLFFNYCLPSVKKQTVKNFTWIIFFNKSLKQKYKSEINKIIQELPQVLFIYVLPEENHIQLLKEYIYSNVKTKFLITSRLDNDDLIRVDYLEKIQKRAASKEMTVPFLLNASNGCQIEIQSPYRIGVIKGRKYSSFLSLISSLIHDNVPTTVLDYNHPEWEGRVAYAELSTCLLWIQMIHERNLANKVNTLRLLPMINEKKFGDIDFKLQPVFRIFIYPLQFIISLKNKI